MNLIKYDAARFALQQAVEIDEVKDIRDKAQAMSAYAKQANDTKLVEWATEIKVRAERKAGKILAEMDIKPGKKAISNTMLPIQTLDSIGVSKIQSSRWLSLFPFMPIAGFDSHNPADMPHPKTLDNKAFTRFAVGAYPAFVMAPCI